MVIGLSLCPCICFLLLFLSAVCSYPVILSLDEEDENSRCLQFSIPEEDDAHVVMLALPDHELMPDIEEVEHWYVGQLYKMTKLKSQLEAIPKGIPDSPPDKVALFTSQFLKEHHHINEAPVKITVSVKSLDDQIEENHYKVKYFIPLVLNHIRKHHATKSAENYEGVKICLENTNDPEQANAGHLVHMLIDMVFVSEEVSDLDFKPPEPGFEKAKHLTPLEISLEQSIQAARTVLKEFRYMEQREQRMRQTADGINARVHYFSYISVAILFGVTYLQVGYLKRYFKKKKLM